MSIKVFCDVCKKELTRNMVADRLIIESGVFKAEVIITKDKTANTGDLCLDCLLKMLNQKPKRKYERKQEHESQVDKRTHRKRGKPEPNPDNKGDNVNIHVPAGEETDYVVTILDQETAGPTLRLAVLATLEEWHGKIPDQLTKEEKALIQGILDARE